MTVSFSTQILSSTLSNVIKEYYPLEFQSTADLCQLMDSFFDCFNSRNQVEGMMKRKKFLEPFRDINDWRLTWLTNIFLKYFEDWKDKIEKKGGISQKEKEKMFIPSQTYEGLCISVFSLVDTVKYLLQSGAEFVLTERFNQDVLEEYFGRQRSHGRYNTNPNINQFGYNSNTIRLQRSVVPVKGNTKGAHIQKRRPSWEVVDEEVLQKKSKKH